jgi:hypothetical protein
MVLSLVVFGNPILGKVVAAKASPVAPKKFLLVIMG